MSVEPIAFINVEERKLEWAMPVEWGTPIIAKMDKVPLYTHQYSDLTDEEILSLTGFEDNPYDIFIEYEKEDLIEFARAILRKAQEK